MWARNPSVFWGLVLVLLGFLFLLANTGVLNNLNWDIIWPVFLIALGAWLLLGRVGPWGSSCRGGSAQGGRFTARRDRKSGVEVVRI